MSPPGTTTLVLMRHGIAEAHDARPTDAERAIEGRDGERRPACDAGGAHGPVLELAERDRLAPRIRPVVVVERQVEQRRREIVADFAPVEEARARVERDAKRIAAAHHVNLRARAGCAGRAGGGDLQVENRLVATAAKDKCVASRCIGKGKSVGCAIDHA